jgi:hypothetical protein
MRAIYPENLRTALAESTFERVAEKEITGRKTPATRYLELQHL